MKIECGSDPLSIADIGSVSNVSANSLVTVPGFIDDRGGDVFSAVHRLLVAPLPRPV